MTGGKPISRRSVLKASSASLGALGLAGVVRGDDTIEIPVLRSDEGVERWEAVPQSWYQKKEQAHRIREQIQFRGEKASTQVSFDGKPIGGLGGPVVKINAVNPSEITVPDHSADIPLEVVKVPEPKRGGCYNSGDQSSLRGGIKISGTTGWGTATCNAHLNGEEYLLTVSHLFRDNDSCDELNVGENCHQGGELIGEVTFENTSEDWALIHNDYTSEPLESWIDDEGNEDKNPTLAGHVTADGLDKLSASSTTIRQMGAASGITYGQITGTGAGAPLACEDFSGHGVSTNINAGDGDSGGPYFHYYDGLAWLVGIFAIYYWDCGETCTGGRIGCDSGGVAAYHLYQHNGITFGEESSLMYP